MKKFQIEVMVAVNEAEPESPSHKLGPSSPGKSKYYRLEKRYTDFLALHNDVIYFCFRFILRSAIEYLFLWRYLCYKNRPFPSSF